MWRVVIIERESGEVVEKIHCSGLREAERVERGVNINLNHEEYCTDIEEIDEDW